MKREKSCSRNASKLEDTHNSRLRSPVHQVSVQALEEYFDSSVFLDLVLNLKNMAVLRSNL